LNNSAETVISGCSNLDRVFLAALFNQQLLYERQIGVRMDKWVDPILQEIPSRMPSGLKSLGVGFGSGGLPLMNIAQISSTFAVLHSSRVLSKTPNF